MNNYRRATNHACDMVEPVVGENGELDFPESTFADSVFHHSKQLDIRYAKTLNRLHPEYDDSGAPFINVTPVIGYYLVALAMAESEFFDYCAQICSMNLNAGVPLVEPLNTFAGDVLIGKLTRPKKRSRPRKKDWLEKSFLWSLTLELVEDFQLKPTRNDESPNKDSACDAVAEALTVCGCKTTYTEIKNLMVHSDSARLRQEFEVSKKIFHRWHNATPPENALSPEYFNFWKEAAKKDVLDILSTFPPVAKKR